MKAADIVDRRLGLVRIGRRDVCQRGGDGASVETLREEELGVEVLDMLGLKAGQPVLADRREMWQVLHPNDAVRAMLGA